MNRWVTRAAYGVRSGEEPACTSSRARRRAHARRRGHDDAHDAPAIEHDRRTDRFPDRLAHGSLAGDRERSRRQPEATTLYQVVQGNLETLHGAVNDGALKLGLPRFVKKELEGYLERGLLCRGFTRLRCAACAQTRLVAFACKGAGSARRAWVGRSATAANLTDYVMPKVPLRQWVLTVPFASRSRLGFDGALLGVVVRKFADAVLAFYGRRTCVLQATDRRGVRRRGAERRGARRAADVDATARSAFSTRVSVASATPPTSSSSSASPIDRSSTEDPGRRTDAGDSDHEAAAPAKREPPGLITPLRRACVLPTA